MNRKPLVILIIAVLLAAMLSAMITYRQVSWQGNGDLAIQYSQDYVKVSGCMRDAICNSPEDSGNYRMSEFLTFEDGSFVITVERKGKVK